MVWGHCQNFLHLLHVCFQNFSTLCCPLVDVFLNSHCEGHMEVCRQCGLHRWKQTYHFLYIKAAEPSLQCLHVCDLWHFHCIWYLDCVLQTGNWKSVAVLPHEIWLAFKITKDKRWCVAFHIMHRFGFQSRPPASAECRYRVMVMMSHWYGLQIREWCNVALRMWKRTLERIIVLQQIIQLSRMTRTFPTSLSTSKKEPVGFSSSSQICSCYMKSLTPW